VFGGRVTGFELVGEKLADFEEFEDFEEPSLENTVFTCSLTPLFEASTAKNISSNFTFENGS